MKVVQESIHETLSKGLDDIQINGAYGFDFSVYDGDDDAYRKGLEHVAEKIVETGVTACVSFSLWSLSYPDQTSSLIPTTIASGFF